MRIAFRNGYVIIVDETPRVGLVLSGAFLYTELMTTVYIDGENFRKNLSRELISMQIITNERLLVTYPVRPLVEVGYTPSEDTLQHIAAIKEFSRHWVASLTSQNIHYIKAGNLKVRSSKPCRSCGESQEIIQEKGTDVRMALDILESAYEQGGKNTILLASSDTDLCPVIHKVRAKGIKVIYLCFASQVNRALAAACNETVAISEGKLRKYAS